METRDVALLLDQLEETGGVRAVILSGMGEPFLHPGIREVVADVKRRGFALTVITNLLLADPRLVLDEGVDQLLVGIHAASGESYAAFHPGTGKDGWETLLGKLALFRDAGRRFKHVQVVCGTNAHELLEMVRLAHAYRAASVTFKLASLGGGTERCGLDAPGRRRLLETGVPAARNEAAALGVETNLDLLARQLASPGASIVPFAGTGCFMGYAYARVTVDREVLFCCDGEVRVGSLAGGASFAALWNGAEWQRLRERLRGGKYFPGCARCGKYAQNVALGAAFERRHGPERLRAVTGRA